jgi:hypothetical protein
MPCAEAGWTPPSNRKTPPPPFPLTWDTLAARTVHLPSSVSVLFPLSSTSRISEISAGVALPHYMCRPAITWRLSAICWRLPPMHTHGGGARIDSCRISRSRQRQTHPAWKW